ncbi:MAG: lipopolysaccharide biosynthesis protein [Bosea sp.]|jgi:O-antigen/teichoic acid export membrane protein|nr:lipopolysaccharide biosynthesis protein [Bosea sp. (in: a-proteobacteria)]
MLLAGTFAVNSALNFVLGLLVAKFLGPEQFGLYALGAALLVLVNAAGIDWLKLSAIRFYTNGKRDSEPQVRATLDALAALCTLGMIALLLAALAAGIDPRLPAALTMAAVTAGVLGGLFDYHQAVARARQADAAYLRMVIIKNILALILMAGGAWWTHNPSLVLAGSALSSLAGVLAVRRALSDGPLRLGLIDRSQTIMFATYAFPLVAGNVLLSTIPLLNRAYMASAHGLAEAGYLALAADIGFKVLATIGATVEIMLLPLAVKALERDGLDAAHDRIARNMVIVLAVMLPVAGGFLAVLPAFEALIVPQAFHGHFSGYLWLLMPAFVALPLMQVGFNAVFLMSRRTLVSAFACLMAVVLNLAMLGLIWAGMGAAFGPAAVALAMSAAFVCCALLVGIGAMRHRRARPPARELVVIGIALGLMLIGIWPLRELQPASLALTAQLALGGVIYLAIMLAGNVAGCRAGLLAYLVRRKPREAA